MSKRYIKNRKREYYYKRAKKEKYRSRASYKLIQLNKKFRIIKNGDYVVDLGAAPGGWSQVALEIVGDSGFVVGVDLQRIRPFDQENFIGIKGDFTEDETIAKIGEALKKKADIILSDASPDISGIWSVDHLRSIKLAEAVLDIAERILKKNGNLLIKVFQGEEFENFLEKIKNNFRIIKTTKPPASRKGSAEMYIAAKGFK